MAEYGLHKNSEGYADPTAYEAIRGMAKPGEIWIYKERECLIINNQGSYSNILQLGSYKKGSIEISGRYAQPGMISYAFNDLLTECVEKITDAEFSAIREEVAEAMGMLQRFGEEKEDASGSCVDTCLAPKQIDELKTIIRGKEDENQRLRGQKELLQNLYTDLLNTVVARVGA